MPATVCISQDRDDIRAAIAVALDPLDLEPILQGRYVAVKPNDTWSSADHLTGVTQADTLRAVLRTVKALGPSRVVVTGGAGAAETRDVFELAGLLRVVEEEDVEFFDHNREPFTEVELRYPDDPEVGGPQQTVMVNPQVLEYETLIAVNQLKLHEDATVTLAMKNIAMSYHRAIRGGRVRRAAHVRARVITRRSSSSVGRPVSALEACPCNTVIAGRRPYTLSAASVTPSARAQWAQQ